MTDVNISSEFEKAVKEEEKYIDSLGGEDNYRPSVTGKPLEVNISPNYYDNPAENPETYGESFRTAEFEEEPGFQNLNQKKLFGFRKNFDIELVSRDRVNDDQVVEYIKSQFPEFNYDLAIKDGASNRDIIAHFTKASDATKLEAFAEKAGQAFVQSLPTAVTAVPALGLALAFPPPAWPATIPISMAAAFLAGDPAGEKVKEFIYGDDTNQPYTPSVRAFGEGGRTLGTGLAFINMPQLFTRKILPGAGEFIANITSLSKRPNIFTTAITNPKKLGPVDKLLVSSVTNPIRYSAMETMANVGAAWGAITAENAYPGDTMARAMFEIGYGILSPSALIAEIAQAGATKGLSFGKSFISKKGQTSREAKALRKWLENNRPNVKNSYGDIVPMGMDAYVSVLLNKLRSKDEIQQLAKSMEVEIPRTTASVANNPALRILQRRLSNDTESGLKIREQVEKEYEGLINLFTLMTNSGDPQLMQEAAQMRYLNMNNHIIEKLRLAAQEATDAAKKLDTDPLARIKFSRILNTSVKNAIGDLRAIESLYYNKVNPEYMVKSPTFLQQFSAQMNDNDIPPTLTKETEALFYTLRGLEDPKKVESLSQQRTSLNQRIVSTNQKIQTAADRYPADFKSAQSMYDDISPNASAQDKLSYTQALLRAMDKKKKKTPEFNRQVGFIRKQADVFRNQINKEKLDGILKTDSDPSIFVPIKTLLKVRSQLLKSVRNATAGADFDAARRYGDLEAALRNDLFMASGGVNPSIKALTSEQQKLYTANQFTRAFHDTISRAFPSKIVAKHKSGEYKITPELLAEEALSGQGDDMTVKYQQINKAIELVGQESKKEGVGSLLPPQTKEALGRVDAVRGAEEQILAALFDSKAVTKKYNDSGDVLEVEVDITKVPEFLKKYNNVFFDEVSGNNRFPNLYKDILDIDKTQTLLNQRIKLYGDMSKPRDKTGFFPGSFSESLNNQFTFANSTGRNTIPTKLVAEAIGGVDNRSAHAENNLNTLIRNTKRADKEFPGALEGLKHLIFDAAFSAATTTKNESGIPITKASEIYKYLNNPLGGKNSKSVLDVLGEKGVIDDGFRVRLNTVLKEGMKVQKTKSETGATSDDKDIPAARIGRAIQNMWYLGSLRGGRYLTKTVPGEGQGLSEPTMVAKELGAFIDVPNMRSKDLIFKAALDKDFFTKLLTDVSKSPSKKALVTRRLRAFLLANGYITASDQERYESRRDFDPTTNVSKPRASSLERERIERSPVRTQPPNLVPHLTKSKPVGPLSGKVSTDAARNYAALNPNDLISPLLSRLG